MTPVAQMAATAQLMGTHPTPLCAAMQAVPFLPRPALASALPAQVGSWQLTRTAQAWPSVAGLSHVVGTLPHFQYAPLSMGAFTSHQKLPDRVPCFMA